MMLSIMKAAAPAIAIVASLASAEGAWAQTFPGDAAFAPLRCRADRPAFDPRGDTAGNVPPRDLVGDDASPAAYRAVDAGWLYLRMRLDADPRVPGGTAPRPFGWGVAFDTNDDRTDYEALLILAGADARVALHRNTTTTVRPNSLADPADSPPLSSGPFDVRARVVAAGSMFGGDPDVFLDLAAPWSELAAVGVTPTGAVRLWVGSSTAGDRLDDDIVCHDGGGGGGPGPAPGDVDPPRIALDPAAPQPGGGGATQTRAFEGGPGCAVATRAPSSATGALGLVMMVLLAFARAAAVRRSAPPRSG
jgi:hypothetical protein